RLQQKLERSASMMLGCSPVAKAELPIACATCSAPGATSQFSVTAAAATSSPNMEPCYFCDGSHLRKACPLSKRDRKEGLRARNRCFRCLAVRQPGHSCERTCVSCHTSALHVLICPCDRVVNAAPSAPNHNRPPTPPPSGGNGPAPAT